MRIGVDMRSLEAGAQHRGIGRYATELLRALSKIDHRNEYVFFTSQPSTKLPDLPLDAAFTHSHNTGQKQSLRNRRFFRIVYIRPKALVVDNFDIDVFFHLDPSQPIKHGKTPVVSVLYDLIPYLPQYRDIYQSVPLRSFTIKDVIGFSRTKLYWKLQQDSVKNYRKDAAIISISEHSKRDLVEFLPIIDSKKIHVTPLAANEPPAIDAKAEKAMKALGLKSFLFYVGGADFRKGLVKLAETMEDIWQKFPDTQLVVAGKEVLDPKVDEAVRLAETASKLSRPKQVIRLGFISDGELAWLYKHAAAFIFPSEYEGFGLPILEAMQMGSPVVTYDNSSLPEVCGDAALVVKNGEDMGKTISKLLGSKQLQDSLKQKGKQQAAKFTWGKTARATLKVLEQVGGKK